MDSATGRLKWESLTEYVTIISAEGLLCVGQSAETLPISDKAGGSLCSL